MERKWKAVVVVAVAVMLSFSLCVGCDIPRNANTGGDDDTMQGGGNNNVSLHYSFDSYSGDEVRPFVKGEDYDGGDYLKTITVLKSVDDVNEYMGDMDIGETKNVTGAYEKYVKYNEQFFEKNVAVVYNLSVPSPSFYCMAGEAGVSDGVLSNEIILRTNMYDPKNIKAGLRRCTVFVEFDKQMFATVGSIKTTVIFNTYGDCVVNCVKEVALGTPAESKLFYHTESYGNETGGACPFAYYFDPEYDYDENPQTRCEATRLTSVEDVRAICRAHNAKFEEDGSVVIKYEKDGEPRSAYKKVLDYNEKFFEERNVFVLSMTVSNYATNSMLESLEIDKKVMNVKAKDLYDNTVDHTDNDARIYNVIFIELDKETAESIETIRIAVGSEWFEVYKSEYNNFELEVK